MPKLRRYYNMSHNFDTFNTPHDALFLVFSMPNIQYLAFSTPNDDAYYDINLINESYVVKFVNP